MSGNGYKDGQKNAGAQKKKAPLVAEFVQAHNYYKIIQENIREFRKAGAEREI